MWTELRPDKAHYTPQHLRDQVAALKRRGFQQTPREENVEPQPEHEGQNVPIDRSTGKTDEQFLAMLNEASKQQRRRSIHHKQKVNAQDLKKVNEIVKAYLPANADLWTINCAVYAAARTLTPEKRKTSCYIMKLKERKKKIEKKISLWRKKASHVESLLMYIREGRRFTKNVTAIAKDLKAKHHTLNKNILTLIKEQALDKLRSLKVIQSKISTQIKRCEQNYTYQTTPARVFLQNRTEEKKPQKADVENFWKGLYEREAEVNLSNPALQMFSKVCDRLICDVDQDHDVTEAEVKETLKKMKNYSAPGPDAINGFWWKKLGAVHAHIARVFNEYARNPESIPNWVAEGRTVLIYKKGDPTKPENYRPITCLNTIYKVFTSLLQQIILHRIEPVWKEIYEQRGTKKGMAGVRENLIIDRSVCQDAIYFKRNLSMAWIDYRKAFDCTSHALIMEILERMKVNRKVLGVLAKLFTIWKTRVIISNGKKVESSDLITYRRGVFQGDSLSPLLFCISMLPLSIQLRKSNGYNAGPPNNRKHRITHLFYMDDLKLYGQSEKEIGKMLQVVQRYSSDAGMEFGIDKCAYYNILKGKGSGVNEEIALVDGTSIKHLGMGESYTYLGTPQNSMHCEDDLKREIGKKYKKKLEQIWSSELNGKNKISASNSMATPLVTQTFGSIYWKKAEVQKLDRTTRKVMNIHRSLHPNASVARLYVPRCRGGRGMLSLEDMYRRSSITLAAKVLHSSDPLLRLVAAHETKGNAAFLYKTAETSAKDLGMTLKFGARPVGELLKLAPEKQKQLLKEKTTEKHLRDHIDKPMHGVYFRNMETCDLDQRHTFAFLRGSKLRSETEGFITAIQDGVFHTQKYRATILKLPTISTKCRACGRDDETTMHLLAACKKYLPTLYIQRHDAALKVLYFHLRHSYGLDAERVPPYSRADITPVDSNERCRIMWNFPFSTTKQLTANRPDMVLLDQDDKTMWVMEMSCPAENRVREKEEEKTEKYRPLMFELSKTYHEYKVRFLPLIIGVMGGVHPNLGKHLGRLKVLHGRIDWVVTEMQKAVILGTLHILRSHEAGYPPT